MPQYVVMASRSAEADLRKLPKHTALRIFQAIDQLEDEPRPRQSRKLKNSGSLYRLRVGVYRIIYDVDDQEKVMRIQLVRHRRDAYRNL